MKKKIIFSLCLLGGIAASWYFLRDTKYYEPLVVQFGRKDTPHVEVQIEGKTFLLEIDTGSKFSVDLRKDMLEKLESKEFHGMGHWKILNGNEYDAPNYVVPKIKLGNLEFKDVIVQQLEDDSLIAQTIWDKDGPLIKPPPANIGSIGRPLLQKFNFLMDYCRTRIIATNDMKKIGELGYFLHHMQKMPFTMGVMGINVEMETKWGRKIFCIDTGSTSNFIRSGLVEEHDGNLRENGLRSVTSQCTLAGRDLGDLNFYSYPLTSSLSDADGILGTPFLNRHVLYIDFFNKILYFRKSQEPPY